EKIAQVRENEALFKENQSLNEEKESLLKGKDLADAQIRALTKSLGALQEDLKQKEKMVQVLKKSLENQRKELHDSRVQISNLKIHTERFNSGNNLVINDANNVLPESLDKYKEEIKKLQMEIGRLKEKSRGASEHGNFDSSGNELMQTEDKVIEMLEDQGAISRSVNAALDVVRNEDVQSPALQTLNEFADKHTDSQLDLFNPAHTNTAFEIVENVSEKNGGKQEGDSSLHAKPESVNDEAIFEKMASPFYFDQILIHHYLLVGLCPTQILRYIRSYPRPVVGLPASSTLQAHWGPSVRGVLGIPLSLRLEHLDCARCEGVELVPQFLEGLRTIQILADALPKIVPYVLINHREELLPLMMCAIEYHPDGRTRDSLTHTLFNLIKRPDEQQRRIIMDACVSLAKNVGEMRTETELLPQCWEQINHMYEERRLLVAQSCGELAEFVRPEIRDSLILSIVQQLIEDSATIVREAAAHNLAKLLPLFPNVDKYFKVEELMFQLICDPSGVVVESTLKKLVPAVIKWGNKLDHVLGVLLSHICSSAQHCPPLSAVEGCIESHLHMLGERERWNIDVLLRMLVELLSLVHQKAIETCPLSSTLETTQLVFSITSLELYARGNVKWDSFEWMHVECFPKLIQLACLLPWKEDNLRSRISKFLLSVSERFGDTYVTCIMLPVFLTAIGDDADLTFFPSLRPRSAVSERLATSCVLPLLLAGVLGAPGKRKELADYSRKLLLEDNSKENRPAKHTLEIINAIRFICIYEENHGMIFEILWEMVVSSNMNMKITAAKLLKVLVPYIDAKVASTHALPALVTLGSEQDLDVKCASIDAFGAVAQHFKNETIVDKIRVQMGAFIEDGSHEATIAIAQLTAVPVTTSTDLKLRQERANAFCEAIRALDATDLSANSIRDYLVPAIQNLLKDLDALDPAHKEALEIIMKERSGTSYKGMGSHVGIASSMSNFFGGGDGGLRGKKDGTELMSERAVSAKDIVPQQPVEDTRFRRIMLGHFGDILRGKEKTPDKTQN
ncbi:lisH domain and HEAT repeat-containing protein KIAA1468, partial [Trifolium pratense]